MSCRDRCRLYPPPPRKLGEKKLRPEIDVRYCQECHIYLQWSGGMIRKVLKNHVCIEKFVDKFHCPCCGYLLRSKIRHNKRKQNDKKPQVSMIQVMK